MATDPDVVRLRALGTQVHELASLGTDDRIARSIAADFNCEIGVPLRPPLRESAVAALEARAGIVLPASYRRYVSEVADGGLGPCSGQYPLERALSFATASAGMFPADGLLPLVDYGCGMSGSLVLEGPHLGEVWMDDPNRDAVLPWCGYAALHGRIDVLATDETQQVEDRPFSYFDWLEDWLGQVLPTARALAAR